MHYLLNFYFRKETIKRLAWAYTALILLLVTLPINGKDQPLGSLNDNYVMEIRLDHLSHALLFIPWVLLVGFGWELHQKSRNQIALSFGLALTFAAFCECLQLLLPYRAFTISDLLANGLGICLGYLLFWGWVRVVN